MPDPVDEKRAADIFEATIDVPTTDRQAAITAACGDDAALAARVAALHHAAHAAEGFLADTALNTAPVTEKPGSIIGRYKLLQQIGEGGFGVVFMAEQEKPVRRTVALKVIKLGMDTREVVARFESERQALAIMDHPNIAKVLDVGSTETGRPFFVMELVRGSPITEYADKHKLNARQRVELASQVCRAVQHAHSKGIIHRDLKPSNVLVTVVDDKPVPKVIDFGIAKATQSRLTDRTLFTAFRQLIGTPQYMSPEQADSDGSDIDTRTDVYSLGVLLYELLVGTTPIDAKQLRSAAYEAMRKMIRDTDLPRPTTRLQTLAAESQIAIATSRSTDVKKLSDSIKGELDWIVMKSLEKDRTRRYETAAAMADDLNRYLAGDAVLAGPVSGMYRFRKTLRRYKAAVGLAAVIALCLLIGVAGTSWGLIQARHQRSIAVAKEQLADAKSIEAENERKTAQGVVDFLTGDLLAKAGPDQTRDHTLSDTLVKALIQPAIAKVNQRFSNQPIIRAAIQQTIVETLFQLDRYDLAEPLAKTAWETRSPVLGENNPGTLVSMRYYGWSIFMQDRYSESVPILKQCWEKSKTQLGAENIQSLIAMSLYASAIAQSGNDTEAESLLHQAWQKLQKMAGPDSPETVRALLNYACTLKREGRHIEALPLFKFCWQTKQHDLGDDHPSTLYAMDRYAEELDETGNHAEAEKILQQCWQTKVRVLGADDPYTLDVLFDYAWSFLRSEQFAQSEPLLKLLWDGRRKALGLDDVNTLTAAAMYGRAIDRLGRHAEAIPLLKQAWEQSRHVVGEDQIQTVTVLRWYASALDSQGLHPQAEPMLKQCVDVSHRLWGNDDGDTLAADQCYANCIASQGRVTDALLILKHCWESCRRNGPDLDIEACSMCDDYARVLTTLGQTSDTQAVRAVVTAARKKLAARSFITDPGAP